MRKLLVLIESPRSLGEFDLDGTDVIYVVGGHGSLQDINRNEDLHRIVEALYCSLRVHASRRAFARRSILTRRWLMSHSSPASDRRRPPAFARKVMHIWRNDRYHLELNAQLAAKSARAAMN